MLHQIYLLLKKTCTKP